MKELLFIHKSNIRQFIFLGGSCFLIFIYLYIYISNNGVLHPEAIYDISHFIEGGMHGFKDFIEKSFNLNMIEGSCYRPRLFAFMLQYLDIKLWMVLNGYGIHIGGRFLLTLLAIPLVLLGANRILRNFFPNMIFEERLFIASGLLFVEQYIVASMLFLRSAKVLSPSVCMFMIGWAIDSYAAKRKYSPAMIVIYSFILSMVVTIDEQVLFFLLIMTVGCVLESVHLFIRTKRCASQSTLLILVGACLSYIIYYLGWGRLLFAHFTGTELLEHPHTFYKTIEFFTSYFVQGITTFWGAVAGMCGNSIVLVTFVVIYVIALILNHNKRNVLWSLYLMGAMVALSIGMVAAHPPIASYPSLKHGMYYINCMFGCIISFWLAIKGIRLKSFTESISEHLQKVIMIVATLVIVVMSMIHMQEIITSGVTQGESFVPDGALLEEFLDSKNYIDNGITRDYFDGLYINEQQCETIQYRTYD